MTDVSLEMVSNEILGVVGESGCGKSTLGRCAVGLIYPQKGEVLWAGNKTDSMETDTYKRLRLDYQMVFQNPYASLNPRQNVKSMLNEAFGRLEARKENRESQEIKIQELLSRIGFSRSDLEKYPHQFSGGQRQRLALSRVLALNPKLIVLDEALSSLDVSIQTSILNLLKEINERDGVGYMFISHDLRIVGNLSHRVMVMYLGQIVEVGPTVNVLSQPRHPYTQILLSSSDGKIIPLRGDPPSPTERTKGCPFSSRCPIAEKRCNDEVQSLEKAENRWEVACWKALN